MKKRILVTGGAGFLGSHLCDRLYDEGFEITIFDDLSRGQYIHDNARFIKGDVNIADHLNQLESYDIIVHCAALCGVEKVVKAPMQIIDDFIGTYNLCQFALKNSVSKFVFFSSGEIYGSEAINARENEDVTLWNTHQTRTSYALSKLMGESTVRSMTIPSTIIRPFNIFGARQIGLGVVHNFYHWAVNHEPLQIFNQGNELRAMCYIDDFIDGCFQAIVNEQCSPVYNLGNPYNTMTVNRIAQTVINVTQSNSSLQHIPKDYLDKKGVTPDISLAQKELNFDPKVSLEDGLQKMIRYL
jgi:UDP-glucose 4-epimerase